MTDRCARNVLLAAPLAPASGERGGGEGAEIGKGFTPLTPTPLPPQSRGERGAASALRPYLALLALALFTSTSHAAPDFETEVLPVLTKAGCNSGSCHGAAIGRGGFRLSLLGYDPALDHETIVHEFAGRRANLAKPDKSLLLAKPTRQLPHEGGHKLAADGEGYRLLREWLAAGAPATRGRSLRKLEVTPPTQTLRQVGAAFAVQVFAHFSDGVRTDVTRWTVFTPADPAALRCSSNGEVTALRRGQHTVMLRYLGEVGCVTVQVQLGDEAITGERPRANFIDDHVNRTLDQLRLPHSPAADERTLVRRVHLDLLGALPTPAEVDAYVADRRPGRYERLLDRLLAKPEFVAHWAAKWGDLLRIESRRLQPQGAAAFHEWVRTQVQEKAPLDRMARELVLALGDGHRVGPANFSRVPGDAGAHAEFVSQVFLGVRLQCANCHNHPFDRWTQDDYHGLAAVFAGLSRGQEIRLQERGETIHPRTGKPAVPRLPGKAFVTGAGDPRAAFADWLTAADNPHMARAAVNRLWADLMGRGLVEPVDDHRATNPPTHPDLLSALASDFVAHRFDVRHTIRTIVSSAAYRRSALATGSNRTDDRFYSRALVRPLPPAVLVDAVSTVTGVAEKLGDQPAGTSAVALGDSRIASQPLDLLGRCNRDASCNAAPSAGGLPLTLHKINGPWLNAKVAHADGRLHRLLRETDDQIVTTLYQTALGRPPSIAEQAHWRNKLAPLRGPERTQALEDFLWALLNSSEFTTNH